VVVLKQLSDAIIDQYGILAVIRGFAVTQDGHSTVLTAPKRWPSCLTSTWFSGGTWLARTNMYHQSTSGNFSVSYIR
jgi:hypothetical protein